MFNFAVLCLLGVFLGWMVCQETGHDCDSGLILISVASIVCVIILGYRVIEQIYSSDLASMWASGKMAIASQNIWLLRATAFLPSFAISGFKAR